MKNRLLKISVISLIIMITLSNLIVFAGSVKTIFNGNIDSQLNGAKTATRQILGMILDIVRTVGIGIALIMLTYIGIKFMMASPSERANIKQYSMNFVIGAVILIGGAGLLTIVKDFAMGI